jgi:DNA-binding NarL/FixJ family response regulator
MDANAGLVSSMLALDEPNRSDRLPVSSLPTIIDLFGFDVDKQASFAAGLERLSHAQRRVLLLIVKGKLNKEIAYLCGITQATVKAHVCEIFRKLHTRTRTETAVKFAVLSLTRREAVH